MPRHRFDEILVDVPEGWSRTTILSLPHAEGVNANFVLSRGTLRPDETLAAYVDREIADLAKGMRKFVLRTRKEATVAGVPAIAIRCAWLGSHGPVEQEITVVVRGAEALLFTATAPKNQADKLLATFHGILEGIRIDDAVT